MTNLSTSFPGDLVGLGTILDDDSVPPPPAGITVNPTSGLVTSEDGATDSFDVVLDTQPTAPVTIDLSSSDVSEGQLVGATGNVLTLMFDDTNWNIPQTVTVTGVEDADLDGDVAYALVAAAAQAPIRPTTASLRATCRPPNLDNESPAGVAVSGITPNTMAPASSLDDVTISGSGFAAGASVTFTGGSGPSPSASNIVVAPDGNSITATVSTHKKAKETPWNVVVTNPDTSSGSCEGCFIVTTSEGASASSAAMEVAAASFDAGTSSDASTDDTLVVSVAAPLPSTGSSSTSPAASEPTATSADEADAVDDAIADFDSGPLDDALLEDLAVALVG